MKSLRLTLLAASLLSTIMLVCAASVFGQQSACALKQSPELRGFRLGMSVLEVRRNLEDATQFDLKMSGNGAKSFTVRIPAAELKEALAEGIDEINLSFIDGKLAVIKATYNSGMTWDGAEDFLTKESESLGLPKPSAANSSGSQGNEKYKVVCNGFAVTLAYSFGVSPNVTINDMAAQKIADQRKENEGEVRKVIIGPNTTGVPVRRP